MSYMYEFCVRCYRMQGTSRSAANYNVSGTFGTNLSNFQRCGAISSEFRLVPRVPVLENLVPGTYTPGTGTQVPIYYLGRL